MKPTHHWQPQPAAASMIAEPLPGDARELVRRIALEQPLAPMHEVVDRLSLSGIEDIAGLGAFLEAYHRHILQTLEFPAIALAWQYASHGQARELIALDQKLATMPEYVLFAEASQRIGRIQLKRLKPLCDVRVVQRYVAALEADQAHAWHPLVYGLTLAVFSLPLRQALMHYGEETLSGLAMAATRSHSFREAECREVLAPLIEALPAAIESQIKPAPWQKS